MATNVFFNNFKSSMEQKLLEDLVIESIRIYGEDVFYIPRNIGNFDQLYMADDVSYYTKPYLIEMYIKSVDGFSGDGNFMSKFGFGLEIRDQIIFSVARRVFMDEVGNICNIIRPREGDLIYFPLNDKCFQIKYVNKMEMFYQLGALQTWEMTCELFEYSDEMFSTGIPSIDALQTDYSTDMLDYIFTDEDGSSFTDEEGNVIVDDAYDLESITTIGINTTLWDESSPFVNWESHSGYGS